MFNTERMKAREIYVNAFGYRVYAVAMREVSTLRTSCELYIVAPDGRVSDFVTISRKNVIHNKGCYDFLYEYEGDFGRDDISVIANKMNDLFKPGDREDTQARVTLEELYRTISAYMKENSEETKDNPEADVFIRNGYGYIAPGKMDEFVSENKDLGYKRLEILKRLKIMGVLRNAKGRPYDAIVSMGGKKLHYYRILLAEETGEEEEEEVEIIA